MLALILSCNVQLFAQESEIFIIEVSPGYYPDEIAWELSELLSGDVIFSTGEDSLNCIYALNGGNGAGTFEISLICEMEYQLVTWDTYGDGWNGGGLTILNQDQDLLLCTSNSTNNEAGCFEYSSFIASCSNGSNDIAPLCDEEPFIIEVSPGYYPDEIAWGIMDSVTGQYVFQSGGWGLDCSGSLTGGNGSGYFEILLQCGVQYTLRTFDTYGDGWNGGELTIKNLNQDVILCTTNSSPDDCFEYLDFQAHCASWNLCSDPNACNFNPEASSNISCSYDCYGCADPLASNYDENATMDPSNIGFNTCVYCDGDNWFPIEIQIEVDSCNLIGTLDEIDVSFLSGLNMDSTSSFQSFTPTPLLTEFHGCATHGCQLVNTNINEQVGTPSSLLIITNQNDIAYWNPEFAFNDQSLCFNQEGCTDPDALNYNSWHTIDDGNCSYHQIQLSLPSTKYNSPDASWKLRNVFGETLESGTVLMFDDPEGHFHIPVPDSGFFRVLLENIYIFDYTCSSWDLINQHDESFDSTPGRSWSSDDTWNYSYWFYLGPGCTDEAAPNYDWGATSDDGSCYTGCTDSSACNYSEWAVEDDGSCAYESFRIEVIQGAQDHRFWWTLGGNASYNNQYNGFPCEQQQMEFNECYDSGCYVFNCSHGSHGAEITHFGNTLYEIEPLQSDFQWDNSGIICLRRPLEICNVTIDENNHCVVQWDAADAAPITLNVGVYKLSGTSSEYELIGVVPIEEGAFVDLESAADINPQSYRIARRIINEGEAELSDSHKTIHLSANLGVNNNVNLWWNSYEGADYANFQLQRLEPGATEWETFAVVANTTNSYTDNNAMSSQSDYRVIIELPSCEPNTNSSLVETTSNVVSLSSTEIQQYRFEVDVTLTHSQNGYMLKTTYDGPLLIQLNNTLGQVVWSGLLRNNEVLPSQALPKTLLIASFSAEGTPIGSQKIILN